MKYFFTILIIVLSSFTILSQNSYCDGWEKGYIDGFDNMSNITNKNTIKPFVPMCKREFGKNTYQDGYNFGFQEGKDKFCQKYSFECKDIENDIIELDDSNEESLSEFKRGWDNGYESGMRKMGKIHNNRTPSYIIPITPLASFDGRNYKTGFSLGFEEAKSDYCEKYTCDDENDIPDVIFQNEDDKSNSKNIKTFCDGWEQGYKDQTELIYRKKNEMTPIYLVPICPISNFNQDTYLHGYKLGKKKSKEDNK